MTARAAQGWPLPLLAALAATLAFCVLALLCEALASVAPAHTPTRSADTGAMELLAPLVWAIGFLGLLVVALPAAALGALLGWLAQSGLRLPVLVVAGLPCGLLLGAAYGRLAAADSALASSPAALICGLGATAAALVAIGFRLSPARSRR